MYITVLVWLLNPSIDWLMTTDTNRLHTDTHTQTHTLCPGTKVTPVYIVITPTMSDFNIILEQQCNV